MARNLSTNTPQNAPLSIDLEGEDPNGGTLTYAIVEPPAHGTLSGSPPNVTYTPSSEYFGLDAFTFKVNDGQFDSAPATVSIKVVPPPMPPSGIVLSTTNVPARAPSGSFIASLRAVDPNESDTHIFTLVPGFGDNASFAINGINLLAGPGLLATPGATFNVRLRATDNTSRWFEQTFDLTVVEVSQDVVINEIHHNGAVNQINDEFVELYNPADTEMDVSLWRLRGGVDYLIPGGTTIPARGFLVLAQDPATLQRQFGVTALGPWSGALNSDGEEVTLRTPDDAVIDQVDYRSVFPWPIAANGTGASMQLVNPALDNDLGSSWRSGLTPTPGATNIVFATNAAPNLRQVHHAPEQPSSTNQVTISCKVTDPDGVAAVELQYQVVAPGRFIPATLPLTTAQLNGLNTIPEQTNAFNPAFEAATNWTTAAMTDDGLNGDEVAGESIYTVVLPQQANRALVRYRITVTDALGASRRAPFEDDPSLNFAYFVYDGIPSYQGVSPAILQSLPVYTLITRTEDLDQCTAWFNTADQLQRNAGMGLSDNEGRYYFNWEGAMVYDGVVYDHIRYRLRGANGRYHPGKRSFRFRFNDGSLLAARDQTGKLFPTSWRELTTGKGQSNRGTENYAMNEVVNYFLWNEVGVPAPKTLYFHFRVIRGAAEDPDRYGGDFWGLNWAQEKYDVHFLDSHHLPKGNLYKLNDYKMDPFAEERYFGPNGATNGADFWNIQNNLNGYQPTDWLLTYVNYTNWYRYHAICEAVRQYDFWPSANKNAAWYFEPIYTTNNNYLGRFMTFPYDSTDTWGPTWNGGQDIAWNGIFASTYAGGDAGQNPELQKEYRNVVREVRDLLFQPDQINAIIDAFAAQIGAFAPADYTRWAAAPAPASYNSLYIPSSPGVTAGLPGYVQDMKNFMFVGGNNAWWIDRQSVGTGGWVTRLDQVAADSDIPQPPTLTYAGTNGYPINVVIFRTSAFADPQGNDTFAALQWRVAEVMPAGSVVTDPHDLKLEWNVTWTSKELTTFNEFITIPPTALIPNHLYRVRVRHEDNTGRWSRWSAPIEFQPAPAELGRDLRGSLVFSEIMYNPPADGALDGDDYEFIELKNVGTNILDLTGLYFSEGVSFVFTNGTTLAPGQLFLLARNAGALQARYPGVVVNGVYSGKLDNGGETLSVSHPHAGVILSVPYDDRAPWPVAADGFGFSLVLAEPATGTYRASASRLGSPGADGGLSGREGVVINEVLSNSTSPLEDMIELLNTASTNVDISGWYLTDDATVPWKYRIADGTVMTPGSYLVFRETDFNPTPGLGTSFSLSSLGEEVYLFSGDVNSQLTGYSHGFAFGGAPDGVSLGRYVNSVGEEQFPLQLGRTFGSENAGPRVGPVVISEIHYHPGETTNEFVELKNITPNAVLLYDSLYPTNTWKVNGLAFSLPEDASIPANGYLLLVRAEPEVFRSWYSVPAAVPIRQYTGTLQDSGENLELRAPDVPTTNGVPYYAVDTVRYNDRSPWPLAADGAGASLQRIKVTAYGDDPVNWLAATPTPGRDLIGGTPPIIVTQPSSHTNITTSTTTFSVSANGSEPLFYQWRFNDGNIAGATNATLLLTNLAVEDAGQYSVVVLNSAGSMESGAATLTVLLGAVITSQPSDALVRVPPDPLAGSNPTAMFSVVATSYYPPMRYQWQENGVNLIDATNSTLTLTNVQIADEGDYRVVVTDGAGSVASLPAHLYPLVRPTLTISPLAQSVVAGGTVTVSAAATGYPLPFSWEWRVEGKATVTNVVYERTNFLTFTTTNVPGSVRCRVVLRTMAGAAASLYVTITTLADSDSDGLPDVWETAYGLESGSAADRDLDRDGDGMTNWQEYLAGTDPTNAQSYLKVDLTATANQPTITFGAVSNLTYTVEYTDQLEGNQWRKLVDVPARSDNHVETVVDPGWTTNRFYRLATPRQP